MTRSLTRNGHIMLIGAALVAIFVGGWFVAHWMGWAPDPMGGAR